MFTPNYSPDSGYMTEQIRSKYIERAIDEKRLPSDAHRWAEIVSLTASSDSAKPIQFWQLYSVLGPERILGIVRNFYQRVFDNEPWFCRPFQRIGGIEHHVNTQGAMWLDVMGGGHAYHGGEYRLSFHHTHNAMELMNERGAERWVLLMKETLNDPSIDMTDDPRVRPAINTFLGYFMTKYAAEFDFSAETNFGEKNKVVKRRINFINMTSDAIEALPESELREALTTRGIDTSSLIEKQQLVNKALSL